MSVLVSVKIPCRWWNDGDEETMAHWEHGKPKFALGVGPCGKTVVMLDAAWSNRETIFTVSQECDDGSEKIFTYRREDITGRIEAEYASAN